MSVDVRPRRMRSLRLDEEVYADVVAYARENRRSFSSAAEVLLAEAVRAAAERGQLNVE